MPSPIIFYDPTSEPSRAVHWFCLEANISHELQYVWLTRGEHMTDKFSAVNPFHQVPALKHGDFCLSEATAIMQYLADVSDCAATWFGRDIKHKAIINKHLSWYHTNLRQILTLDYFIPVLLMPAYLGIPQPSATEVSAKADALKVMLGQLDSMLSDHDFLSGPEVSAPDILFSSEVFALKIDRKYSEILEPYSNINDWLSKLQKRSNYSESHKVWDHVVPLISKALERPQGILESVTKACEKV
jgi:glutathione S-transferase